MTPTEPSEPDHEELEYKVKSITDEEYFTVRNYIEEQVQEQANQVYRASNDQDEVMFLITSMGGRIAYYKKETECTAEYNYLIALPKEDQE